MSHDKAAGPTAVEASNIQTRTSCERGQAEELIGEAFAFAGTSDLRRCRGGNFQCKGVGELSHNRTEASIAAAAAAFAACAGGDRVGARHVRHLMGEGGV